MAKRNPATALIFSEGKPYSVKMPTPGEARAILRPHGLELGYLASAWNQLHHNLSCLFALLLNAPNAHFGSAIWYATENDFLQRKLLRSIVEVDKNSLPRRQRLSAIQADGILWVLNQIDENLRHKRNNALHAPLMIVTGVKDGAVRRSVEAHFNQLNPRARPLRGKDLVQEFKDYTEHAMVLSRYALALWYALSDPAHKPWPDKPKLPKAHKMKGRARPKRVKPPPRQRGA